MPSTSRLSRVLGALTLSGAFVAASLAVPAVASADTTVPASCAAVADGLTGLGLSGTPGTADDGTPYTLWTGTVAAWDGIPLAVDLTVPDDTDCAMPLVSFNHGYGGSKAGWRFTTAEPGTPNAWHWNNVWFAMKGYASLAMTARGFKDSCGPDVAVGGVASGLPAACSARGQHYWISMSDYRYAVRDLQWVIGRIVDTGLVDSHRIVVTGGSMGGAMAWNAAVLNDRVACGGVAWDPANGVDPCAGVASGLVPWRSPAGVPLSIAAAVPEATWSTLTEVLMPNGLASDGTTGAPVPGNSVAPVGIPNATWMSTLQSNGLSSAFFEPAGTSDPANGWGRFWTILNGQINTGVTKVGTALGDELRPAMTEWNTWKSATSYAVPFDAKVPVLQVQGITDSITTPVQAQEMWRKAKAYAADYPITDIYMDGLHAPSSNPADEWHDITATANTFVDAAFTGVPSPSHVEVYPLRCVGTQTMSKLSGPDLNALEPSSYTVSWNSAGVTNNTTTGYVASQTDRRLWNTCPNIPTNSDTGVARWTASVKSAQFLMGAPTVTTTVTSTGYDAQLNVRVWDLANNRQTLVTRGTYRLAGTANVAKTVKFQLPMTAWRLAAGHTLKVEVAGRDTPTWQQDWVPAVTTVKSISVRFPTGVDPLA